MKTDKYGDFGNISRPLTKSEISIFEREIDNIYQVFIKHVSEGRNMSVEKVDNIAQGRIWGCNRC